MLLRIFRSFRSKKRKRKICKKQIFLFYRIFPFNTGTIYTGQKLFLSAMKQNFRQNHLLKILEKFEKEKLPLDVFLSFYFRANKSIGSKDRKFIAESIYKLIRWAGLVDYYCQKPLTWEKRLDTFKNLDLDKAQKEAPAPHIKVSFPKRYFDLIKLDYGEEKALQICLDSNTEAPTTIRTNPLKISRDELFEILQKKYEVSKCKESDLGIIFHKKINFFASEEFKKGFFEVQDEGSQLIAKLILPKPNSHVLDYCAGSGGKTLSFAHLMQGKGQIYLHDIRPHALLEAKKRLKRAGIHNAQIILPDEKFGKLQKLDIDWILLDVPCSGSGTLRRNPDMKWRFNTDTLNELIEKQRNIFDEAITFLKPKGSIVYSTCSIFSAENEAQIEYFLKRYPLELKKRISWLPKKGEKDGFFGAVLEKK